MAEDGVTEDELATVQAQAERDWLEQLATCAGRADEISHHALLFGDRTGSTPGSTRSARSPRTDQERRAVARAAAGRRRATRPGGSSS